MPDFSCIYPVEVRNVQNGTNSDELDELTDEIQAGFLSHYGRSVKFD